MTNALVCTAMPLYTDGDDFSPAPSLRFGLAKAPGGRLEDTSGDVQPSEQLR